MFLAELTFYNHLFAPASHLCVAGVVLLIVEIAYTTELLRGLDVVWILGKEEPTLKVVPTEAFECKLTSTLTTYLVDKLLLV